MLTRTLTKMRFGAMFALLVGLLAACDAPPPSTANGPTLSRDNVEIVAAAMEAQIGAQIGKPNGAKKDWRFTRVSRKGAHVTSGIFYMDRQTTQNIITLRNNKEVQKVLTALARQKMCSNPVGKAAFNAGLKYTMDIVDARGTTITSVTVDRC